MSDERRMTEQERILARVDIKEKAKGLPELVKITCNYAQKDATLDEAIEVASLVEKRAEEFGDAVRELHHGYKVDAEHKQREDEEKAEAERAEIGGTVPGTCGKPYLDDTPLFPNEECRADRRQSLLDRIQHLVDSWDVDDKAINPLAPEEHLARQYPQVFIMTEGEDSALELTEIAEAGFAYFDETQLYIEEELYKKWLAEQEPEEKEEEELSPLEQLIAKRNLPEKAAEKFRVYMTDQLDDGKTLGDFDKAQTLDDFGHDFVAQKFNDWAPGQLCEDCKNKITKDNDESCPWVNDSECDFASKTEESSGEQTPSSDEQTQGENEQDVPDCEQCEHNYCGAQPGGLACKAKRETPDIEDETQGLLLNRALTLMTLARAPKVDTLVNYNPGAYSFTDDEEHHHWLSMASQLGQHIVSGHTAGLGTPLPDVGPLVLEDYPPLVRSEKTKDFSDWRSKVRSVLKRMADEGQSASLSDKWLVTEHPEMFELLANRVVLTRAALEGRIWFKRGSDKIDRE